MGCDIKEWTATRDGPLLLVRGEGTCTEGGYRLRLEPTNEGIVDEPDLIALRLHVEPPDTGTTVITPMSVEWSMEQVSDEIRRVRVDTPAGSEYVSVAVTSSIAGTSLDSFSDAASRAFRAIEGDPRREGAAAAEVVRMWLTKGGFVGRTQYHVEIARIGRDE